MITESLLEEIKKGRSGNSKGCSMGFPKLEDIVDGITRGTYTCIMAQSSIGKSSFALYSYVYRPLMEHLETDDFKISFFALEQTAPILLSKLLSTYIFETYGKQLGYKELLSRKRDYTLSDEDYQLVQECIPWMEKVEKHLTVYDKGANTESIIEKLMNELKQEGEFKDTPEGVAYFPHNPKLTHVVIVDHVNLLMPTKGRSVKQEIDLLSHTLVNLRNKCNISPVAIMQSNRDSSSTARAQLGDFLPKLSDKPSFRFFVSF